MLATQDFLDVAFSTARMDEPQLQPRYRRPRNDEAEEMQEEEEEEEETVQIRIRQVIPADIGHIAELFQVSRVSVFELPTRENWASHSKLKISPIVLKPHNSIGALKSCVLNRAD